MKKHSIPFLCRNFNGTALEAVNNILTTLGRLDKVWPGAAIAFFSSILLHYILEQAEIENRELLEKLIACGVSKESGEKSMGMLARERAEGVQEGIQKGAMQAREMMARSMLSHGLDMDKVAKWTAIDLATLQNIKAKLQEDSNA